MYSTCWIPIVPMSCVIPFKELPIIKQSIKSKYLVIYVTSRHVKIIKIRIVGRLKFIG